MLSTYGVIYWRSYVRYVLYTCDIIYMRRNIPPLSCTCDVIHLQYYQPSVIHVRCEVTVALSTIDDATYAVRYRLCYVKWCALSVRARE